MNKEQLKIAMPHATVKNLERAWLPLDQAMAKFQINNPARQQMFIAQLAHESGELRYTRELADGKAYDTRTDLGNTPAIDGDGELTKGRGYIQITGTTNYIAVGKALGVDFMKFPAKLEEPYYAAMSAGWFWFSRGLNEVADVNTEAAFLRVSIKINGKNRKTGLPNHWLERLAYWNLAKVAFQKIK